MAHVKTVELQPVTIDVGPVSLSLIPTMATCTTSVPRDSFRLAKPTKPCLLKCHLVCNDKLPSAYKIVWPEEATSHRVCQTSLVVKAFAAELSHNCLCYTFSSWTVASFTAFNQASWTGEADF